MRECAWNAVIYHVEDFRWSKWWGDHILRIAFLLQSQFKFNEFGHVQMANSNVFVKL